VAATYPLEVVQAARWRQANIGLTEDQVLAAIETMDWDPSVKALTPFTDLIDRLSQDLDWLQQLGDAFLQNEQQVISSIQYLRQKAHETGSIADNDYYDVERENNNIIITSTNRDIVYVPYYDSRVVYGHWGWNDYQPVYWHRPSNYRLHAGFYWSDRFYIRPTIFFGGFRWGSRNLVVNQYFYDRPYRYNSRYRNIGISNYKRWIHNPVHRRGVRYSRNGFRNSVSRNTFRGNSFQNRSFRNNSVRNNSVRNRSFRNNDANFRSRANRQNRNRVARNRAQQQSNNRGRQSNRRDANSRANVNQRNVNRRVANVNRNASRQRSDNRSRQNNDKVNRRNNGVNKRVAAITNNQSKRNSASRNGSAKGGNKRVNKKSNKKVSKNSNSKNGNNKSNRKSNKSNKRSSSGRSFNKNSRKQRY